MSSRPRCYISLPMNGRSEEAILENIEYAKKLLRGVGYEPVDAYADLDIPQNNNPGLTYLAHSLEIMATCQFAYFMFGWEKARGCQLEHKAAQEYGLRCMYQLPEKGSQE